MQDNPTDPRWEDQGWEQMKQLLDQEMPVAGGVAPAVWPAYLRRAVGLLAIIGLGFMGYQLLSPPADSGPPTVAAFAIPLLPLDKATEQAADSSNPGSMGAQAASVPPVSSPQPSAAEHHRPLTATPSRRGLAEPVPQSSEAQPLTAQNAADPAKAFSAAPPTVAALATLPRRETGLLSQPTPLPTLPERQTDAPLGFAYGIEAGFGTATFEALQSGTVAAFAQIPIGTASAWYARASIGYQQLQQSRTVAEQSFLFSSTRMPDRAAPVILQSSVQVRELAYLYLLPQIGYQVHPRLSVEGGVQYGYLLRSQSATEWSVAGEPQTPTPIDNQEEGLLSRLPRNLISDEPAVPLRSAHWALQLGLRYRLNRHFSVSAQWQHGLTNIYQSKARTAYNRFGHLGVAYRIR